MRGRADAHHSRCALASRSVREVAEALVALVEAGEMAALAARLDAMPALALASLDATIRRLAWKAPGWRRAALRLATMHPDGRVRQKAIRRLGARDARCLLLRVNDWVPEVRAAARRALARCDATALVSALPLLERARQWQRVGDRRLLDEVEASIPQEALEAGL